jgi:hypothetical protein
MLLGPVYAPQPDGTTSTGEGTDGSTSTDTPPTTVTPPPQPPAGTTTQPPAGEPPEPNWKKKFQGLQPVYQELQERHKNLLGEKDTLTASLSEVQGQLEAMRTEFDAFKGKSTKKEDELSAAMAELADYKLLERKTALLRQQAPHLLQFEPFLVVTVPDELLDIHPDSMTEEQSKKLDEAITTAITNFSQVMEGYVGERVKGAHAGATPPTSAPRPTEPSLEGVYQKMLDAAGTDEYKDLEKLFVKMAEKQEGARDQDGYWRPQQS